MVLNYTERAGPSVGVVGVGITGVLSMYLPKNWAFNHTSIAIVQGFRKCVQWINGNIKYTSLVLHISVYLGIKLTFITSGEMCHDFTQYGITACVSLTPNDWSSLCLVTAMFVLWKCNGLIGFACFVHTVQGFSHIYPTFHCCLIGALLAVQQHSSTLNTRLNYLEVFKRRKCFLPHWHHQKQTAQIPLIYNRALVETSLKKHQMSWICYGVQIPCKSKPFSNKSATVLLVVL